MLVQSVCILMVMVTQERVVYDLPLNFIETCINVAVVVLVWLNMKYFFLYCELLSWIKIIWEKSENAKIQLADFLSRY